VSIVEGAAVLVLVSCVGWGAWTHPHRPFSWGMYSESSKGYLWVEVDGEPRPISHTELRLAPGSHFLTLPTLRRFLADTDPSIPLRGLIIGSAGSYHVRYDPDRHRLGVTRLTPGTELETLGAALQRLAAAPSWQPPR
jgi:hypothetical protein